jgi:hypothetical protein
VNRIAHYAVENICDLLELTTLFVDSQSQRCVGTHKCNRMKCSHWKTVKNALFAGLAISLNKIKLMQKKKDETTAVQSPVANSP